MSIDVCPGNNRHRWAAACIQLHKLIPAVHTVEDSKLSLLLMTANPTCAMPPPIRRGPAASPRGHEGSPPPRLHCSDRCSVSASGLLASNLNMREPLLSSKFRSLASICPTVSVYPCHPPGHGTLRCALIGHGWVLQSLRARVGPKIGSAVLYVAACCSS